MLAGQMSEIGLNSPRTQVQRQVDILTLLPTQCLMGLGNHYLRVRQCCNPTKLVLSRQWDELPLAQHALIESTGRLSRAEEQSQNVLMMSLLQEGEKSGEGLAELLIVHRETSCERLMEH